MVTSGKLKDVFKPPRRSEWFAMRLLPDQKASIREAAQQVGESMTGYLLALHNYAVGAQREEKRT